MKEFKHSCTQALHLTSCDFPARGPSVSHPKPLPAPGDPAGGGNVRAGAGRAAPRRRCPALPRRGAECRGANGGGAGSVRAKTDLAGRTVKSTTQVRCRLRPTQTLSALLLITTRDQGGLQSLPGPPRGHPPRTLSPREDPTRPSAESENPRARHRNGTDWPLDILWRVPQRGLQHPEEGPCVGT